jgi:hypothetical protein
MITVSNPRSAAVVIPGLGSIPANSSETVDETRLSGVDLTGLAVLAGRAAVGVSDNFRVLSVLQAALPNVANGSEPAGALAVWSTTDSAVRVFTGGDRGAPVIGSGWRTMGQDLWQLAGDMNVPRVDGSLVALSSGKAMYCGGTVFTESGFAVAGKITASDSCEIFDGATGKWTIVAPMPAPRWGAGIAYLAATNEVLVVGGYSGAALAANIVNTTFKYSVATNTWSTVGAYPTSVAWGLTYNGTANGPLVVLKNGKVLAVGGFGALATFPGTVEVVNGSAAIVGTTTTFEEDLAAGQTVQFGNQLGTSYTILSITNNTNLTLTANFTGATNASTSISPTNDNFFQMEPVNGRNSAAIFTPGADTWAASADTLDFVTIEAHLCLLHTGKVLVTGGATIGPLFNSRKQQTAVCMVYDPVADTFTPVASMPTVVGEDDTNNVGNRTRHVALALPDGRVFVGAGQVRTAGPNSIAARRSCLVYNPQTDAWTATATMPLIARRNMIGTVLPDGRVYVGAGDPIANFVELTDGAIYNPTLNTWATGATQPKAGQSPDGGADSTFYISLSHSHVTLSDGRMMIAGGGNATPDIDFDFPDGFADLIDRSNKKTILYSPPVVVAP